MKENKANDNKKIIIPLFMIFFLILSLNSIALAKNPTRVLCSTFPIYLLTKQVTEKVEGLEVKLLVKASLGCPHDYTPTITDLENLSTAEILIVNGLGMEYFLDSALKVTKKDLKIITATSDLSTMPLINEPDTINNHLFVNPRLAALMAENIAKQLAEADPDNAIFYLSNAERLKNRYTSIANEFVAVAKNYPGLKIITSHDFFDYLGKEMNFETIAYISTASELSPTASDLKKILTDIKQKEVKMIIVSPESDPKLAQSLAAESKLAVMVFDGLTFGPENPPLDYYEQVMAKNLHVLSTILKTKEQ